jgi:hypothetical protein
LQARIQTLQSALLLAFNLIALMATLVYIWVIYSQVVVIRHHWARPAGPAIGPTVPEQDAPAVTSEITAPPPVQIATEDVVVSPVETLPATAPPADPLEKAI